jgi:molybdate-binding protein/DNA-binding XRE family transcriptional regulator
MIMSYDARIMASPPAFDNRVRTQRQARGWSQAELAARAGISRTAVSAIEARRLVPSVAAALSLSRVLGATVEDLFGPERATTGGITQFAWLPSAFPCRYWAAEVGGRTLLYPVENGPRGGLPHDGVAASADVAAITCPYAAKTMVLAGCDPAAGLLAAIYRRQGGLRMLVFTRTSGEALALLERGLIHAAGVHLADVNDRGGNAAALARLDLDYDLHLLHLASWEEGLAFAPRLGLKSAAAAIRRRLRWIGRPAGAGARRSQDLVRGDRPAPRHAARDHRGVVEAIRSGLADVGVCVRLASEEGQLGFLPIAREPYDLCYRQADADDPRLAALARAVQSGDYRRLLADLPGYQPQNLGEVEHVRAQ